MFSVLKMAGAFLGSVLGKATTNKDKILEAQSRANEAEIAGAPASILRLWRSFLMWVLTLIVLWEVVGRTIIQTYWPNLLLPPSMLNEILPILMGGLGLGI